jgi:hypothetical protein
LIKFDQISHELELDMMASQLAKANSDNTIDEQMPENVDLAISCLIQIIKC